MKCNAGHDHDTRPDMAECDRKHATKAAIASTIAAAKALAKNAYRHDHRDGVVCPVCAQIPPKEEPKDEGAF